MNLRGTVKSVQSSDKYKLGRYDLNDVLPICDNCGQEIHLETPHDVIRGPGNPARKLRSVEGRFSENTRAIFFVERTSKCSSCCLMAF